jgi:hypothetical protein
MTATRRKRRAYDRSAASPVNGAGQGTVRAGGGRLGKRFTDCPMSRDTPTSNLGQLRTLLRESRNQVAKQVGVMREGRVTVLC